MTPAERRLLLRVARLLSAGIRAARLTTDDPPHATAWALEQAERLDAEAKAVESERPTS